MALIGTGFKCSPEEWEMFQREANAAQVGNRGGSLRQDKDANSVTRWLRQVAVRVARGNQAMREAGVPVAECTKPDTCTCACGILARREERERMIAEREQNA